ncbi:hypothetical protein CRUP_026315 [Coryphaenoides rupestris]|nr:hypothetical protein CRUP_026315 [Coryphaenoides rupestris]
MDTDDFTLGLMIDCWVKIIYMEREPQTPRDDWLTSGGPGDPGLLTVVGVLDRPLLRGPERVDVAERHQHAAQRPGLWNSQEAMKGQSTASACEKRRRHKKHKNTVRGEDIVAWLADRFNVDAQEARSLGCMLVAFGYVYPLQDHKRLTPYFWPAQQWPVEDTDYAIYLAKRNIRKKGILELYEQEQYSRLHKWMNHKWDFIIMQAKEQYRAGKERKKPDRVVFDCQERAYWVVHRPPEQYSRLHKWMNHKWDFIIMQAKEQYRAGKERKKPDRVVFDCQERAYWVVHRPPMIFTQQSIMRPRMVKYCSTYKHHDPFLAPCLPSNPLAHRRPVEDPPDACWKRWTFSFGELLSDPRGARRLQTLPQDKEFSVGENLAFWEGCEDLKWGTAATMKDKAQQIYKTFLARGAPRWINIDGKTMEVTRKASVDTHAPEASAEASAHRPAAEGGGATGQDGGQRPVDITQVMSKLSKQPPPRRCPRRRRRRHTPPPAPGSNRQILERRASRSCAASPRPSPTSPSTRASATPPPPTPPASPPLPFLSHGSACCPSPISVAIDSTPASERGGWGGAREGGGEYNVEGSGGVAGGGVGGVGGGGGGRGQGSRSRVALSLGRLLKRGCAPATVFASLSPKCPAPASMSSRVQPISTDQPDQAPPRRIANFFQIKVDIPPECRIYPIDSEEEEDEEEEDHSGMGSRGAEGTKEIICPWESLTPPDGPG